MSYAIGVDLGGTKIEAALISRAGQVLLTDRRPTPAGSPALVLDALAETITTLLRQAAEPVTGIGIGSPGQVDPYQGIVSHAYNLGWEMVPLVAELEKRLEQRHPIFIQRDSLAELLGEAYFGAGLGCRNLVYLGLGTGLGGAALADGQLITGHTFTASEIGHLVLDPAGRPWGGGLSGSAESVLSGSGVLAEARELIAYSAYPTRLVDSPTLSAMDVVEAAYRGDELATAVFAKLTTWLTRVLAIYAIVLNPERIIIGGGLGKAAFDLLLPQAQQGLKQWALKPSHETLAVVRSQVTSSAIGAACLVWQAQKQRASLTFGTL